MSYIKDKTIIDFLSQVESLIQSLNTKFEPIYYFTLGHVWHSYLTTPKSLPQTLESFSMLHQYEEFQAISNSQRNKLLLDMLLDPQGSLEQKLYALTSDNQEESKENIHSQPNQNSTYMKERRQKCIEIYDKAELKLAEHLALTEEDTQMLPIDLVMWGFFACHLQSRPLATQQDADIHSVFEKLLTLRQAQISQILSHNQKMRVFIKLYNEWELDLNTSFAKLLENPSLGSKPLSSLIVAEEKMNEVMIQQLALEEKFEQEKARQEKEMRDHEGLSCNLCLMDLYEKGEDIFFMDACLHNYHESCLSDYLRYQVEARKFPVKCPDESCKEEFSMADLKELMNEENIEKFYDLAFKDFITKNGKDMCYCPTPDCTYVFFLTPELTSFDCPNCLQDYCLKCKNRMHPGGCEEHGFIALAEHFAYKPCPSCKFWIEKTEGCDHMVCRCRFEFCYSCGGDWANHQSCGDIGYYEYYGIIRNKMMNGDDVKDVISDLYIENKPVKSFDVRKRYIIENPRYQLQGFNRQARIQKKKGKR